MYSNKTLDYGFYNFSYRKEADKVNAIGICRGDIEPEDCRGCLEAFTTLLSERCGIRKEVIGDPAFIELTSWCMKGCLYLGAVHLDTT